MPRIPEETIEEIRRRADIVSVVETYVPLQKRNNDFWGCCPFHREKTPSFKVSAAYQSYHCFGCGVGGNVFQFVMSRENVDFVGAVELLAQRFNVIVPETAGAARADSTDRVDGRERAKRKERLFACMREIADWYRQTLNRAEGRAARAYLEGRRLDRTAVESFGIGFAPDSWDAALQWGERHGFPADTMVECGMAIRREDGDKSRIYDRFRNRVMFPIRDELGRVVGFSGRTMEAAAKSAKYINTPETALFHKGRLLYGLDLARTNLKRHGFALVCEGQLDVIACHRSGLDNAVAPQGTAFTENQARVLKRFAPAVVFAFDADSAGLQAAAKSIEIAMRLEMRARVVGMPEGEDPDSIFRGRGGDELRRLVEGSEEAMDFLFRFAARDQDPESVSGKEAIARLLIEVISVHPSPVSRSAYCQWLGQRLHVPDSAILEMLNRRLRATRSGRRHEAAAADELPERAESVLPAANSRLEAATMALLDLALYHGSLAHRLTESLHREYLGHNPPAMALNLVLDETEGGHHAEAGKRLASVQDLVADPRISRVLADSQYPELPAEVDDRRRRQVETLLNRALDDCLKVVELHSLENALRQLDGEIDSESDAGRQREKLLEYQKLAAQVREMRR